MSGPYPPPGHPGPSEQGGGWAPGPPSSNPPFGGYPDAYPGVSRTPGYDFPNAPYGGLMPGGWGEPPRRRKNTGRWIVTVVAALVVVGGITTAVVLLSNRDTGSTQAKGTANAGFAPAAGAPGAQDQRDATTSPAQQPTTTGAADGTTDFALAKGECATARLSTDDERYVVTGRAACGSRESDLVLARLSTPDAGCADHQYLRVDGPGGEVYCFTLDVRQGDCLDNGYLKTPCPSAPYTVLSTEAGPGGSDSCSAANGATHWVPIGHDPVGVGCIGPAKNS